MVIPKYAGYVPSIKPDGHIKKRITEQSRDVLKRELLDDPPRLLASTGFNQKWIPKHDVTLESTCKRYGRQTMPETHPSNNPTDKDPTATTFRASYRHPKTHARSVFRTRDPAKEFSDERLLNCAKMVTDKTKLYGPRQALIDNCSGYNINSKLWDATSWATESNLHTDQERT